jgi:hypothetical protein
MSRKADPPTAPIAVEECRRGRLKPETKRWSLRRVRSSAERESVAAFYLAGALRRKCDRRTWPPVAAAALRTTALRGDDRVGSGDGVEVPGGWGDGSGLATIYMADARGCFRSAIIADEIRAYSSEDSR